MANQSARIGFTYCWSDHATAKVYVGVHLGSPSDGYICSSKVMLSEYKKRSHDFTREVLYVGPYEICASFEKALIAGLFKTDKNKFYNRSNGKKILFDEEIRQKISEKAKGRKMTPEHLKKMLSARDGKPGPRLGAKLSQETKNKISTAKKGFGARTGHKHPLESRLKMSKSAKKRPPRTEETRVKLSESSKASWLKRKQERNLV